MKDNLYTLIQLAIDTNSSQLNKRVNALAKIREYSREDVKRVCLEVLRNTDDTQVMAIVLQVTEPKDSCDEFLPFLLSMLHAEEVYIRAIACSYLKNISFDLSRLPLLDLLNNDPAPLIRCKAVQILGEIADYSVLDQLNYALLHDHGFYIQQDHPQLEPVLLANVIRIAIKQIHSRVDSN